MHQPITIPRNCPFCHKPLNGTKILVSFHNREFVCITENKGIGSSVYTVTHKPVGCEAPELMRLIPPNVKAAAIQN